MQGCDLGWEWREFPVKVKTDLRAECRPALLTCDQLKLKLSLSNNFNTTFWAKFRRIPEQIYIFLFRFKTEAVLKILFVQQTVVDLMVTNCQFYTQND